MAKEVKFKQEDLEKVQSLQQEYLRITNLFGQMKITQLNIEKQEQDLMDELAKVRESEQTVLNDITEKYGPGQLDPSTGTFTPVDSPEEAKK